MVGHLVCVRKCGENCVAETECMQSVNTFIQYVVSVNDNNG